MLWSISVAIRPTLLTVWGGAVIFVFKRIAPTTHERLNWGIDNTYIVQYKYCCYLCGKNRAYEIRQIT